MSNELENYMKYKCCEWSRKLIEGDENRIIELTNGTNIITTGTIDELSLKILSDKFIVVNCLNGIQAIINTDHIVNIRNDRLFTNFDKERYDEYKQVVDQFVDGDIYIYDKAYDSLGRLIPESYALRGKSDFMKSFWETMDEVRNSK